jgi:hypothetical protein
MDIEPKQTRIAMERGVTAWFQQQPKEFYAAGFQGLVKRWTSASL